MKGIITIGNEERIESFISKIKNKKPVFICVIGNTETGKIPGISAAGANPDITDFTPAADMEFLYYNRCRCIDGVPVTPDGIPTPALITKAALDLLNVPHFVAVGGVKIIPDTPYIEFGGTSGMDISTGKAVLNAKSVFENAKIYGQELSKTIDYLVIGESIAGGTTTALGVLTAMGYDAADKISSSLPINPLDLKNKIINEGLSAINKMKGDFKKTPFAAIEALGDPMQPACAGLIIGAAEKVPVILAGGTQMAAVAAIIHAIKPFSLENVAIGTTKWIVHDKNTDLKGIIDQINPNIPILVADFDFSTMKHKGLRVYEQGIVKEGVGAGGMSVASIISSQGEITIEKIQAKVEEVHEEITSNLSNP